METDTTETRQRCKMMMYVNISHGSYYPSYLFLVLENNVFPTSFSFFRVYKNEVLFSSFYYFFVFRAHSTLYPSKHFTKFSSL